MERKTPINEMPQTAPQTGAGTRPARRKRGRWKVPAVLEAQMGGSYAESAFVTLCRYLRRGAPLEELRHARACLDKLIRLEERKAEAAKERAG